MEIFTALLRAPLAIALIKQKSKINARIGDRLHERGCVLRIQRLAPYVALDIVAADLP